MTKVSSNQDIKKLGTILSVWAHPDDETLACAGIMASAVARGQKVVCVTATRGEAGSQDNGLWPPSKLGDIRAKELQSALAILGIKHHHWLGFLDGKCADVDESIAADALHQLIQEHKPTSILTFGANGLTGHPDHSSVSRWVDVAVSRCLDKPQIYHAVILQEQYDQYLDRIDKKINIFFNIDRPPLMQPEACDITYCCSDKAICTKKRRAIAAMPSQQKIMLDNFDAQFIDKAFMYEAFVRQSSAD
jgi:LmbE family N-acetylglucosaminyl deacetylase